MNSQRNYVKIDKDADKIFKATPFKPISHLEKKPEKTQVETLDKAEGIITKNNTEGLQMLKILVKENCSDSSDFEFSLGNNSSQEEKDVESSDTGKSKSPLPVAEEEPDVRSGNKQEEVSSDDSADEENLNDEPVNFTRSKYVPTREERMKLAKLSVKIRHPVLPQHKVESAAGTRTLRPDEKEKFEQHARLKSGKFNAEEDRILRKNWKTFCQDNDWDPKNPKPFLFMKHKNKEFLMNRHSNRKKFIQCLAHNLPERSLYSVFQRFRNLFQPHKTCKYTEEEDHVIIDFVETYEKKKADDYNKDRKFAELAVILRRTRASVWRRYRVLKTKQLQLNGEDLCHSSK